jgi:hypothetical protein
MHFRLAITLLAGFLIAGCGPSLTSSGPSKRDATVFSEKEFYRNKMFFLDTAYRSFYLGKRPTVPDVKAEKLQIWLSNAYVSQQAYAKTSTDKNIYRFFGISHLPFLLLKMGTDYNLDSRWKGVVRFDSIFISQDDLLGIHLETEDSNVISSKGVFWDSGDTSQNIPDTPWTLKFPVQDSTYQTFPLMWRNVYFLPSHIDLSSFRMRIVLLLDTMVERAPDGRLFTEVLGLSDKNGAPYLSDNHIFDVGRNLLIIPSFDSSNQGNEPFSNPALGKDNINPGIYREIGLDFIEKVLPKFMIIYSQAAR